MLSREDIQDKVFCVDCIEFLNSLEPDVLDLTCTSPPYNVDIQYGMHEDTMNYVDYLEWLEEVFRCLFRAHKDHSYVAVNIGRNSEFNTPAHYAVALERAGFQFYKSVVWVKPQGAAVQTAWYKDPYPRYYQPYLVTEDILIYSKGDVKGEYRGPRTEKIPESLTRTVANNVWHMQPDSHKVQKGIHPAPFPIELPGRLVQLLSLPGELVYDPFAGSGTTLLAAKQLNRHYVGTDIDENYCAFASDVLAQRSLFS